MNDPIARLSGLYKHYGPLEVLSDFSLEVCRGECVGLLGPNGAGKTTTLKLITGQAEITAGEIEVFGYTLPAHYREVRARLGVVTQDDTLDEELNCFQNLTVFGSFFGVPGATARRRAEELLEFVHLSEKRTAGVKSLSGGMRQRLLIARSLINAPDLLILDEPTTGLDPQARQNIWQKLRALKRQGTTMLLTTHYMEEAEQLCDRLVILDLGKVVARGRPADLIQEVVGREVLELRHPIILPSELAGSAELGELEREAIADTLYVFLREGDRVPEALLAHKDLELFHRRATLEDVFLRLTGRELTE